MGSSLCCLRVPDKKHDGDTARRRKAYDDGDISGDRNWPTGDGFLSDASTFSVEEQSRRLKAARFKEQRLSREAEEVITCIRQESARFDHAHTLTKS